MTGRRFALALVAMLAFGQGALVPAVSAQDLSALARFDAGRSFVRDDGAGVAVTLGLTQPVPWRVRVLADPPRVVLDFREVDFAGVAGLGPGSARITGFRAGTFRAGWSRLVLDLAGPMVVDKAAMQTAGAVAVQLVLRPASEADFAARAAEPEPADWALPAPALLQPVPPRGQGPLIVVLDPGHGGIDPGAERDGTSEARLMLIFARELKEVLLRDGGFRVALTREEDVFVPLETRISIAHQVGAQVFVSLHADALSEGEAVGATIYTLSEAASDVASATLAERHNRDDLLAGLDLGSQDDVVVQVLMDMVRAETTPRSARLAEALVAAISAQGIKMHRHPRQEGSFSVLKSPDIPSVLVELGFLSSASDMARLMDRDWRFKTAGALRDGLKAWAADDAARAAAE